MAMLRDGKHPLTLTGRKSPRSKRTRSVYFVESPGGTVRKMSPTKMYRATGKLPGIETLPDSDEANSDGPLTPDADETEDEEEEDDDLAGMSVKEKLLKGIEMGHRESDSYRDNLAGCVAVDPQVQLLGPPEDITTISGMQKAMQRAYHVDPRLDISPPEKQTEEQDELYEKISQMSV